MAKDVNNHPLTVGGLLVQAATNGINGGVHAVGGKFALSFFRPELIVEVDTLYVSPGIGALAFCISCFPNQLIKYLIDNATAMQEQPYLASLLKDTASLGIYLGSLTGAALMLGLPPLGLSVICMMVIPTLMYALRRVCELWDLVFDNAEPKMLPEFLLCAAPFAALWGAGSGLFYGICGQEFLALLDSNIPNQTGAWTTYSEVGALSYCISILPKLLIYRLIEKNEVLNQSPLLKTSLMETFTLLNSLSGVMCAALILGLPPLGATVMSLMVIPTAIYVISSLVNLLKAFSPQNKADELEPIDTIAYSAT